MTLNLAWPPLEPHLLAKALFSFIIAFHLPKSLGCPSASPDEAHASSIPSWSCSAQPRKEQGRPRCHKTDPVIESETVQGYGSRHPFASPAWFRLCGAIFSK